MWTLESSRPRDPWMAHQRGIGVGMNSDSKAGFISHLPLPPPPPLSVPLPVAGGGGNGISALGSRMTATYPCTFPRVPVMQHQQLSAAQALTQNRPLGMRFQSTQFCSPQVKTGFQLPPGPSPSLYEVPYRPAGQQAFKSSATLLTTASCIRLQQAYPPVPTNIPPFRHLWPKVPVAQSVTPSLSSIALDATRSGLPTFVPSSNNVPVVSMQVYPQTCDNVTVPPDDTGQVVADTAAMSGKEEVVDAGSTTTPQSETIIPEPSGQAQKRKLSGNASIENSLDNDVKVPVDMCQPLYCKLCNVSCNAPAQATAHYTGKSHSKKAKQYIVNAKKLKAVDETLVNSCKTHAVTTVATKSKITKIEAAVQAAGKRQKEKAVKNLPMPNFAELFTSEEGKSCQLCCVVFTSPYHARQHYDGKPHQKKMLQKVNPPPTIVVSKKQMTKTIKYTCTLCNMHLISREQLQDHIDGAKHKSKVNGLDDISGLLKRRWVNAEKSDDEEKDADLPVYVVVSETYVPVAPSTKAKVSHKSGFSMYKTPSGKFYCSCCDTMLNSESHFAQHLDSKKHKQTSGVKNVSMS
ncbi:PREDICTED: uncharacterized protein LOC106814907 [Priapulus caudatus]|uniref:Uncharacterized protein LOC106814907 n=1 Tax=Priapulus caudatus TaxID=37621 RepID=A0ABM1ERF0_PRICU|nr:PREDICTED: uncharacterized protein LOC106814907 [Priapulus caudatus]XP_014674772.1 PREDICTED: uncharacterized protein LOC106814907 [Priapulus caudatus]